MFKNPIKEREPGREGQLKKIDKTGQEVCLESVSRRLWFGTSAQFTEPETKGGKNEGKKGEQGRELQQWKS